MIDQDTIDRIQALIDHDDKSVFSHFLMEFAGAIQALQDRVTALEQK